MAAQFQEILLHPPGGVAVNQWKGGELHFRCGPASYGALAQVFQRLAMQCQAYHEALAGQAQAVHEAAPQADVVGARIAQMEAEIARMRNGGIPVSVNTNPVMTPAAQLAAAVVTRNPVTVAQPGPSLLEVDAALRSRSVQHPEAAAAQVAHAPAPLPPPNVPPQPPIPPHIPVVNAATQNTGPVLAGMPAAQAPFTRNPSRLAQLEAELAALRAAGAAPTPPPAAAPSLPEGTVHIPVLLRLKEQQAAAGSASPDAPGTIISGGREADDGELGPPPASI